MDANMQKVMDCIRDRMERGELTASAANIEIILAKRVHIIRGRVPSDIRKTLSAAVKAGSLGHMRKDGFKPEVYFHPSFEYLANGTRKDEEDKAKRGIATVCGWPA